MKKAKIDLIMSDMYYGRVIGSYLANNAPEFEVKIFKKEDINEGTRTDANFVITDEKSVINLNLIMNAESIRILLEEESEDHCTSIDNKCFFSIQKYLSASNLLRELRFICSGGSRAIKANGSLRECIFVGFWGGGSGTGKTSIAIGLARDLAKRFGKSIFYLNFESYPSTKVYFTESLSGNRTISDFLYYLFRESRNARMPCLDSFIFQDVSNLCGFFPAHGQNELKTLKSNELDTLLKYLVQQERFDYVFIDCSGDITEESFIMLERCSVIYSIVDEKRVNMLKNQTFEEILRSRFDDSIYEKVVRIFNMVSNDETGNCNGHRIPLDSNSFFDHHNFIDISIGGVFGNGLKAIGDRLMQGGKTGDYHAEGND